LIWSFVGFLHGREHFHDGNGTLAALEDTSLCIGDDLYAAVILLAHQGATTEAALEARAFAGTEDKAHVLNALSCWDLSIAHQASFEPGFQSYKLHRELRLFKEGGVLRKTII
jgi:hypothetical protein